MKKALWGAYLFIRFGIIHISLRNEYKKVILFPHSMYLRCRFEWRGRYYFIQLGGLKLPFGYTKIIDKT